MPLQEQWVNAEERAGADPRLLPARHPHDAPDLQPPEHARRRLRRAGQRRAERFRPGGGRRDEPRGRDRRRGPLRLADQPRSGPGLASADGRQPHGLRRPAPPHPLQARRRASRPSPTPAGWSASAASPSFLGGKGDIGGDARPHRLRRASGSAPTTWPSAPTWPTAPQHGGRSDKKMPKTGRARARAGSRSGRPTPSSGQRPAASLAWTNWPLFTVGMVQRGYSRRRHPEDPRRQRAARGPRRAGRERVKERKPSGWAEFSTRPTRVELLCRRNRANSWRSQPMCPTHTPTGLSRRCIRFVSSRRRSSPRPFRRPAACGEPGGGRIGTRRAVRRR